MRKRKTQVKIYEDRDKETRDMGDILIPIAVNVMADNTTVWYSAFLAMHSEILALWKTMAKIPLTSVMPRQMELPCVSQHQLWPFNLSKSLLQPDAASPVSPITLPEPGPKGQAGNNCIKGQFLFSLFSMYGDKADSQEQNLAPAAYRPSERPSGPAGFPSQCHCNLFLPREKEWLLIATKGG